MNVLIVPLGNECKNYCSLFPMNSYQFIEHPSGPTCRVVIRHGRVFDYSRERA